MHELDKTTDVAPSTTPLDVDGDVTSVAPDDAPTTAEEAGAADLESSCNDLEHAFALALSSRRLVDFLDGLLKAWPETSQGPNQSEQGLPALRELLLRYQLRGAGERRMLLSLIRRLIDDDLECALPVIAALLARRLALPSARARKPASITAAKQLLRDVQRVIVQAGRIHGPEAIQALPELAARVGMLANERQLPLAALPALLERGINRAAQHKTPTRPLQQAGLAHVRCLRLPAQVEIVIYIK